jgi:hypothetical protein
VELASRSLGAPNSPELRRDIVINELMYNPPSGDDADEFLELFHTGTSAADLSGWRLASGIRFNFPAGTTMQPGGYLVVAKDRARLLANHPGLDPSVVVGDYDGVLSNSGETVLLQMPEGDVANAVYVTVDEVTYRDGGQWGVWADGGGSSLELIDPLADNRLAANWADSDESEKAPWATVEHTGVLDLGRGAIDEVQILLLGGGECLIDDVEVFSGGGPNQVLNGDFESGLDSWVLQGNHVHSGWSEPGQGDGGSRALHLRATGGGDNGANRVESDLTSSLSAGNTATIRARARWLRGHPDLLVRLHGNHLEAAETLPIPTNLGTPGAPNSRSLPNAPRPSSRFHTSRCSRPPTSPSPWSPGSMTPMDSPTWWCGTGSIRIPTCKPRPWPIAAPAGSQPPCPVAPPAPCWPSISRPRTHPLPRKPRPTPRTPSAANASSASENPPPPAAWASTGCG